MKSINYLDLSAACSFLVGTGITTYELMQPFFENQINKNNLGVGSALFTGSFIYAGVRAIKEIDKRNKLESKIK